MLSSPVKSALVLSSGGLFGAYQVGVWNYLSESSFRPDLVVGASAGALNGWAIAAGAKASELADRWLDETQTNVLKRRTDGSFRAGFFHHEPLQRLTSDIFSDYPASENFGLVTVQLPFLRSRLFRGAAITASHLLASSSIPIAMPTVMINGQRHTDGGLLEDVPLWAAVEMGATQIIAVDAMHFDSPWWYRIGVSPTRWFAPKISSKVRSAVTLIRPSRPLGHYSEALDWNKSRLQRWIERGYEDARRTLAQTHIASFASA